MKFWLLTHKFWNWNFSVNLLISSFEKDILFWWESEGCHVRAKEEEGTRTKKRVEKEGLDFLIWCSQENKIREKTFGVAKGDKESGLGMDTCDAKEEKSQPTFFFNFFGIHTYTVLQRIISLYTHTHIYISLPL